MNNNNDKNGIAGCTAEVLKESKTEAFIDLYEEYQEALQLRKEVECALDELRGGIGFDIEKAKKDPRPVIKLLMEKYLQLNDIIVSYGAEQVNLKPIDTNSILD